MSNTETEGAGPMSLGNVTTQREHCNPHCPALYAYIDTIEVFFPSVLTREQYLIIKRYGRVKECRDQNNRLWGYRLILNQPVRQTLPRLDRMVKKYRGLLCRWMSHSISNQREALIMKHTKG
jgi:hypothetical protein